MIFNLFVFVSFYLDKKGIVIPLEEKDNAIKKIKGIFKEMNIHFEESSSNQQLTDGWDLRLVFNKKNPDREIEKKINQTLHNFSFDKGPIKAYFCNWNKGF